MDEGKYDDLIRHGAEVDRVREASHQRAAYLGVDARVRQRRLPNRVKCLVHLGSKPAAKPRTLVLVPVTSLE